MAVATYTKAGAKATTPAKLNKAVFAVDTTSHELLKVAYIAHQANLRQNLARTKTRGEVRGSTIKPWKQKGTGRARFGSRYNPIWRGGGITFGPTGEENYKKSLNVKAKRLAIKQALTISATSNKLIVIEDIASKEGKTKDLAKLLDKIGAKRNIVLAVSDKSTELIRASQNIPNLKLTNAKYLNVFDILNADSMVLTKQALTDVSEWLTKEGK